MPTKSDALKIYEKAREKLHVSAVPQKLPCRECEFAEIYGMMEQAIEEQTGACLYISGVPGTGKTATVHEAMRLLKLKARKREISPFQFVELNGMRLSDPYQAYSELWQALSGRKVSWRHASELLDTYFRKENSKRKPIIVLMDELDQLLTRQQQVLYHFFEWPNQPKSKLIILAVANMMNLPERLLKPKVASRLGMVRINFEPYTSLQLITVIRSRLEELPAFDFDAIELCARKVAAFSGDARRALDICRRAVEMIESDLKDKLSVKRVKKDNLADYTFQQVTMSTIDAAYREYTESYVVQSIQNATLYEKLFLCAIIHELRANNIHQCEFSKVMSRMSTLSSLYGFDVLNASEVLGVAASLGTSHLILLENPRNEVALKITLNCAHDEVTFALREEHILKKLL